MHSCEIRLLDPAGMVAEIHPGCHETVCSVSRARILLRRHPEMTGAEVRVGTEIIEVACDLT